MDQLIASGRVEVNGVRATAGLQVDLSSDRVSVDGREVRPPRENTYLILNKPRGVLTTVRDEHGRPTVLDRLAVPRTARLFPVGRLDLNSRGLVILTDDGELAMRLTHPRYHVEKEYRVRVSGRPSQAAMHRLREGMTVGEEQFAPAQVRVCRSDRRGTELTMVLREGRKRQVRRLWQALGHRVEDLQRVRIGPLHLGTLRSGAVRPLTPVEVQRLRSDVRLGDK